VVGKRETGFTLVELMIVVLLMGILAAIAAPSYQGYMARSRLNGAARMVFSDLATARMDAVNMNRRVQVFFDGTQASPAATYRICDDASGDGAVASNEGRNIARNIRNHYGDVSVGSNNDPIFLPNGTAAKLPTIKVSNSKGDLDITISIAGRALISEPET